MKSALNQEQSNFGSTATELEFVGDNPTSNAQIIYYLKKRHILGKMDMEIQDENGKKIVSLILGKKKGINLVNWAYNMKNPKTAVGKTMDYPGFTAPRVQEGTYKAVITKGKETYSQNFKVVNDPKSAISVADRLKQKETTRILFNLSEELAYTVYEIDETIKLLDLLVEKNKAFSNRWFENKVCLRTFKSQNGSDNWR